MSGLCRSKITIICTAKGINFSLVERSASTTVIRPSWVCIAPLFMFVLTYCISHCLNDSLNNNSWLQWPPADATASTFLLLFIVWFAHVSQR